MSYEATVYNVMIASPSDVVAECGVIRETLSKWNSVHSADKGIVVLPIDWKTHASPAVGDRPQEIINRQVLADADLLVAVFWTRIGSPTGKAPSGTIEEIREHIAAGKPVMLYFLNLIIIQQIPTLPPLN